MDQQRSADEAPAADAVLVMIDGPHQAHIDPTLALRTADAYDPQVLVNDLGITRGDGIFEVVGALGARPQALAAHLERFTRSARLMDLPTPEPAVYRAAVHQSLDLLARRHPGAELSCRFLMTRGQEYPPGSSGPTGWAVATLAADHSAARTLGLRVVTLDRGLPRDVMATAPWLLAGAKTLSYAVNRSVLREAHRRGADDTLLVSSDGWVLEGPSSSFLVVLDGQVVTPPAEDGVLPGTTQADAFRWFASRGIATRVRSVRVEELAEARAAWLTSSSRLAAPVRELDGRALPVDVEVTAALNDHLQRRDG